MARPAVAQTDSLLMRAIPGSGELVPAVGLGTARIFDNANEATRAKAAAVVQALVANGGRIIDTASTYGDAEIVMGAEIAGSNLRDKIFIATKLESPDRSELKRSLNRLKTAKVDLLQLHNVEKQRQSLAKFREWKSQGICRYIGVTSTFHRDFPAVEAVLRREKPDFVQIDYSIDVREAEKRILPLAADREGRRRDGDSIWQRPAVPRGAGSDNSRLGERICRQLGTVLPEVSARRYTGDRRDSGNRRFETHDR